MPHDPYRALYLHVPFCVKRCSYCDFTTSAVAADNPRIDAYVEDLCLAIRRKSKEGELSAIETVYLGGGTPSHIGMSRLSMLLYALSTSMPTRARRGMLDGGEPRKPHSEHGPRHLGAWGEQALHWCSEL